MNERKSGDSIPGLRSQGGDGRPVLSPDFCRRPRADGWLVAALLAAAGVRVVLALSPQVGGNAVRWPDSHSYLFAAESLLDRGELWFSEAQRAKREPGYPLFIAGCYAVLGRQPAGVRLVQAVLGALLCWPAYVLARRLAGPRAGRVAAALIALHPYLALFSVLLLTEGLLTLLLWSVVAATTNPEPRADVGGLVARVGPIAAAGVGWAALAALRSQAMVLFAVVAATALVVSRPRRALAVRLAAGLAGMALVAALWAGRNQRVVGHPVIGTLNAGETLYDSLGPQADGRSDKARFMPAVLATAEWQALDEVGRDGWLRRQALAYARAHPGHVLRLAPVKFARTWSPVLNAREYASPVVDAVGGGAFAVVVLLALWGAAIWRRRWRTWVVWLAPALVVTAIHLVIVGSIRYRMPVVPFFVVMAGAACGRPPWGSRPAGQDRPQPSSSADRSRRQPDG